MTADGDKRAGSYGWLPFGAALLILAACLPGPIARSSWVATPSLLTAPASPTELAARLRPALAQLVAKCKGHDERGTAFIVGRDGTDLFLMSARHVLYPAQCSDALASALSVRGAYIEELATDRPRQLIVHELPDDDLILLRVPGLPSAPALPLGLFDLAMGGSDEALAVGFSSSRDSGQLPAPERASGTLSPTMDEGVPALSTNAPLLDGMSGGPVVLRSSGLVVGVVRGKTVARGSAGVDAHRGLAMHMYRMVDALPESLQKRIGLVFHYPVAADFLPPVLDAVVVQREEESRVHKALDGARADQRAPFVLLSGGAGVGKTTLALQVARNRQAHPETNYPGGVVFLQVHETSAEVLLSRLYHAMTGRQPQPQPPQQLAQGLQTILRRRPPTLVLLDDIWLKELPQILLETLSHTPVLATSRGSYPEAQEIPIATLSDARAFELVTRLRKRQGQQPDAKGSQEICKLLGNHPLAINLAAGVMQVLKLDEDQFLVRLRDGRLATLSEGTEKPERSIPALLQISFDKLSAPAQRVFVAMGQLAEAPISEDLLSQLLKDKDLRAATDELVRISLVERHFEESSPASRFKMHPLVQEWAGQLARTKYSQQGQAFGSQLVRILAERKAGVSQALLQHFLESQQLALRNGHADRVLAYADEMDTLMERFGYWLERKQLWQVALASLGSLPTAQFREQARVRAFLASCLQNQGDFVGSQQLFEQSLRVSERIKYLEGIVGALGGLGDLANMQGNYAEAKRLLEQSLRTAEQIPSPENVARMQHGLGNVADRQGNFAEAKKLYEESLQTFVQLKKPFLVAMAQMHLGTIVKKLGDSNQARKLYEQSLSFFEQQHAYAEVAGVQLNLGILAAQQGDFANARQLMEQSLKTSTQLHNLPHLAEVELNLGRLLVEADPQAARQHFEIARRLGSNLSPQNIIVANSLWGLTGLAMQAGDKVRARQLASQAREIFRIHQDPHLSTLDRLLAEIGAMRDPASCRAECEQLKRENALQSELTVEQCAAELCKISDQ